jgi:AraC-like DNA-binding protein
MFFRIYQPTQALSDYVKCYWILEYDSIAGQVENIVPDGSPELIFHFGSRYRSNINGKESLQPLNLVVGQLTSSIKLQTTGATGIFAVRFHPWGLYPFAKTSMLAFTNNYACVDDVLSTVKNGNISERIMNASHADKVSIVDEYLIGILGKQLPKIQRQLDCIVPIWQYMYKQGTSMEVHDMARHSNMGVRQYNRLCNEVIGLSPKQLSRILRFNGFMEAYKAANDQSLTQVLYNSGYYDQSHFIRDFKDITGETPSVFFKRPNELAELLLF